MKNSLQNPFLKLCFTLALCASFSFSYAQVDTSLASGLLKGDLQNHLISKLGGRLGEIKVSERFTAGNSTIQIASRQIPSRLGTLDQITIKITEAGKTQFFSLTQGSDGKLSELRSGQLVAISGGNPLNCVTQLFGAASSCSACKTKILNCISQNNTFLARVRCLGRNFDGTCISCGVSLVSIVSCLKG
ncbi:hypothetical protein [Haliscomenobacter sp.]|uniref:hypothetical protein n=1 Tax=Haliscomenobacter sp. TaxID=2717303 RepID=UPI003BA87F83